MIIAKISHVPIHEPILINGQLSTAWVRFFEQLARGIDVSELVDLLGLAQVSHQLPSQAVQGDLLYKTDEILPQVVVCHEQMSVLPMVSVQTMELV